MATKKPASTSEPNRREQLLLNYLAEFDAACPVCGYNVRGLRRAVCPECSHELSLTVGAPDLKLGWLLFAVVPGFFAGIAGCLLVIPAVAVWFEDGAPPWQLVGFAAFGWASGLFALVLAFFKRRWFVALSGPKQRVIASYVWLIHIIALGLFLITIAMII